MRLKLTLKAEAGQLISFNYQYHLSSAIYNLLRFGSPEFSSFLHDNGYKLHGRSYKLFTFALRFENYTNLQNAIKLDEPQAKLYISSPMIDDFIKHFIIGTFENQVIDLSEINFPIKFKIIFAEMIPLPDIKSEMHFKMLSPMVLSSKKKHNGKISQYYLRQDDKEDINRILSQNLRNKFETIYSKQENWDDLKLSWDDRYLLVNKRITKKITINQHGKFPIDVIALNAPFSLSGNVDLIKVGYECGFGEKNSMGFGMVEVINGH
ncbi:MAG: CRISPR-associated endoribonuclease Cas6 [Ignavibacteriaceae bacterium]|nr:CRISPR-associated endoribonuclease Cas6 [Ignavibacteriaceae bacterium]